MSPLARLRSVFWDLRPVWRRPARGLRRRLSLLLYRLRKLLGKPLPPRVVTYLADDGDVFPHPALSVWFVGGGDFENLARQTETSWDSDHSSPPGEARYLLIVDSDPTGWPPTLLESLVLTAAALPLSFLATGYADAAQSKFGPETKLADPLLALRSPDTPPSGTEILGRAIPHITAAHLAHRPQVPAGGGFPAESREGGRTPPPNGTRRHDRAEKR